MKADRSEIERLVKTARGQLDGILKMIEEDRYCIDISNQLLASLAVLKKANNKIIAAHLNSCVKSAIEDGSGEQKLKELSELIDRL
jgi:DNA-binding FrmR family transcriptional regulator